jgi:predicted dehydrogenase
MAPWDGAPGMTSPISAAIVGAGLMGRWHADAAQRAGGRIAAVIDVNDAAAVRLAARVGCAVTARSLQALTAETRLDVVHVCTPLGSHEDQVRVALARGHSMIVEKPLVQTAAQTQQLLEEAQASGCWIVPVHQALFQDGVRRAVKLFSGRPLRVFDYRACSAGAEARPDRADDIAAEILPHPLSLLDGFLPGALDSIEWNVERTAPGELAAGGVAGATAIRLMISMHARPPRHELTLFGDDHTVTADLFHGFSWRASGRTTRPSKIARPFTTAAASAGAAALNLGRRVSRREPAYPGLAALVRAAYAALRDPAKRPLSDRHTLAVARARDAILHRIPRA